MSALRKFLTTSKKSASTTSTSMMMNGQLFSKRWQKSTTNCLAKRNVMVPKRQFIITSQTTFAANVPLTECDETEPPFI